MDSKDDFAVILGPLAKKVRAHAEELGFLQSVPDEQKDEASQLSQTVIGLLSQQGFKHSINQTRRLCVGIVHRSLQAPGELMPVHAYAYMTRPDGEPLSNFSFFIIGLSGDFDPANIYVGSIPWKMKDGEITADQEPLFIGIREFIDTIGNRDVKDYFADLEPPLRRTLVYRKNPMLAH